MIYLGQHIVLQSEMVVNYLYGYFTVSMIYFFNLEIFLSLSCCC